MRRVASRKEMQRIDAVSIEEIGIPGLVLMEKAAMAMEEEVCSRFGKDARIVIVAEKGNNGGDGLALGRLLIARGYGKVTLVEVGGIPKASESYRVQRQILDRLEIPVLDRLPVEEADVYVDAIFGVGLTRDVAGVQREVIEEMNRRPGYKIALDVPSGLDASSGRILGVGFRADLTITVGLNKIGLLLYPGAEYAGQVLVKDIGFPEKAVEQVGTSAVTYDPEDLSLLPQRNAWSNKGTYGKVLLIAGSKNMAGAAVFGAQAAYRSGAGLVRILTCEENREILQNQVPEAILTTYRVGELEGRVHHFEDDRRNREMLKEAIRWASVIGIGPGLGTGRIAEHLLRKLLKLARVPLVIDADGINTLAALLAEDRDGEISRLLADYEAGIILTPHLKEMSRLTGQTVGEIQEDLIATAESIANERHVVVLKDARTIVSDGTKPVYINVSGNHGMATGGSGDVLTGIICGLLAQMPEGDIRLLEAARLGVYCHGLAGDAAAKDLGFRGIMAGDLPTYLSRVIP